MELEAASGHHSWFCDQLRLIGDHLSHDDKEGAVSVFHRLDEAFRDHEESEEQILVRLETALEA